MHKRLVFSKKEIGEAIKLAAKENYERDVHSMGVDDTGPWDEVKGIYLEESEYIIKKTGENWIPELPHHHIISIES